jgi:hypothetical protein
LLQLRQSYLDCVGLKAFPAEVALPVAVPWNLVAMWEAHERGGRTGSYISNRDSILVNAVHAWAAYRQSTTIYEIKPRLAACLRRAHSHLYWTG